MPGGAKVRILYVGKDAEYARRLRLAIGGCLCNRTCALSETADVDEALTRLRASRFDLVALDLADPSAAARLLAEPQPAQLVVLPGPDKPAERRRAVDTGFCSLRPCAVWRAKQTAFVSRMREHARRNREFERDKEAFLAEVFHELRSPLTVVHAALAMLRELPDDAPASERAEALTMAWRNCDRLLRKTVRLLDQARLESGLAKPQPRRFDLGFLLVEVCHDVTPLISERAVRVVNETPDELPAAWADPDDVIQVLHNLLENAARFARSTIVVRAKAVPGQHPRALRVSVVDDGPGLSPERDGRLFSRFVQFERRRAAGYKGTGLGLNICRDLVGLNGGRIWAEGRHGRGARFHFTIPMAAPAETPGGREALAA